MVRMIHVAVAKTAVVSLAVVAASCAPAEDAELAAEENVAQAWKQEAKPPEALDAVFRWNGILLAANALDHTPVGPGEDPTYGEQLGRPRSARAAAIVEIAAFDAFNSIAREYRSYTGVDDAVLPASPSAAVAQASHDALVAVYPAQKAIFDEALARDLASMPRDRATANGIAAGKRAAAAIVTLRTNDGSQYPDPIVGVNFFPSNLPGKWRPDPVTDNPTALGALWYKVQPFTIRSAEQFPIAPPPRLGSLHYALSFAEVKWLGGDGITTPTVRNEEQTLIGIYWAYDGTPLIGTPSRMSNQIATVIAKVKGTKALDVARLFALVNVAEADAALTCWTEKWDRQYWRPTSGIREADKGTGPTGLGDGNPLTRGDVSWTPLGAPASNTMGQPNFTPPFPSYGSGHAAFAGAFFQVLRRFYGTDRVPFTFVSDELNGITRDNQGRVRPRIPRSFETLSQAEEEEGQSRIYLGIHWSFDKVSGLKNGRAVGNYVFDNAFRPRR